MLLSLVTMTPMSTVPAGWYTDPADTTQERLWTGSDWSQETRPVAETDANTVEDTISKIYAEPPAAPWYFAPPTISSELVNTSAPSLRDLLDGQTPLAFEASKPRSKRVKSRLIWVSVFVVFALGSTVLGLRADQSRHVKETKLLLELVETSENAMIQWQKDVDEISKEVESICTNSQEDCQILVEDPEFVEGIKNLNRELKNSLVIVAEQFRGERGLNILFWHKDITLARDRYLDHNAAWVRWMDAASRDLDALSASSIHDDDIEPTFIIACASLRRIKSSSMYPNISSNNSKRIEAICAE